MNNYDTGLIVTIVFIILSNCCENGNIGYNTMLKYILTNKIYNELILNHLLFIPLPLSS